MKDIGSIFKQAQKMQEKLASVQEQMASKTMEASVGGGMVTVKVNGKQEVLSIKLEPEVVNPQEIEMLEDLILSGVNEALRKAQASMAEEMSKITGGLKIPGMTA